MRHKLLACAAAATLAVAGGIASADLIIGNFNAGVGTGTAFGANTTTDYKAFGFTMGADPYFLDGVTLTMTTDEPDPQPLVEIWSGANLPQVNLLTLDNPAFVIGQQDYLFTPPAQFTLDAGETYWVRIQSVPPMAGPYFTWDGTNPSTFPAGPAAVGVNYIFNGSPSSFYNRLQVEGTLVPAPGAAGLLALGVVMSVRRRR